MHFLDQVALHHDYFKLMGVGPKDGAESVACFKATARHLERERRLVENSHAYDD